MDTKSIADLATAARNVALTALIVGVTIFLFVKSDVIVEIIENMSSRMQSAEVSGMKLSFGSERGYHLNEDIKNVPYEERRTIRAHLKGMTAAEVERLLHRSEYSKSQLSDFDAHCDFEMANKKMKTFAAADAGLIEKKLVERVDRRDLTRRLREDLKFSTELGEASGCYQLALTGLGSNLRSLLISEVARIFGTTSVVNDDAPASNEAGKGGSEQRPPKGKK